MYCTVCICIDVVCTCIGMYQYVLKTFKDPMHAYDHGVAIYIIQAIIKTLHGLETSIGLAKNTLVKKLTAQVHGLCNTLEVKHTTLMSFVHQSIVQCFENYSEPNKADLRCPIVDATDVQRLMLTLPFILDGLAVEEVDAFNAGKSQDQHVTDPLPEVIAAVNEWLHWYHLYRQQESDEDSSLPRLDEMGKELLSTLQTVFPFTVKVAAKSKSSNLRSMWCNEKVHSIVHGSRNIRRVGRSKNITCQVTESKHRDIKAKGHMTNKKPGEYCKGVMQGEARESAAQ